jgi:hypothetical protein
MSSRIGREKEKEIEMKQTNQYSSSSSSSSSSGSGTTPLKTQSQSQSQSQSHQIQNSISSKSPIIPNIPPPRISPTSRNQNNQNNKQPPLPPLLYNSVTVRNPRYKVILLILLNTVINFKLYKFICIFFFFA